MKLSQSIVGTVALVSVAFAGNASGAFTNLLPNLGESNTFNSYTTGNLGTQGSWNPYVGSTYWAASDYTIANDPSAGGTKGKSVKILTKATASGSSVTANVVSYSAYRDMYQGVTTAWNARTAGQNYMVMNFSSYVVTGGTSTTAAGQFFGSIQNQEGTVLAGIGVRGGDGEVFTWAYKTGGSGTGTYITDTTYKVNRNSWNTFTVGFNTSTYGYDYKFTDSTGVLRTSNSTGVTSSATGYYIDVGSDQGLSIAKSQISMTGYFDTIGAYATIPSPGAFALIGLAGLVARRRR